MVNARCHPLHRDLASAYAHMQYVDQVDGYNDFLTVVLYCIILWDMQSPDPVVAVKLKSNACL